jgi:16S rRNA (guanine(1405)-N(7))-methyltransferase
MKTLPSINDYDTLIDTILQSRKYRDLAIPTETVRDLLEQELPRYRTQKEALEVVRKKLHNIMAPYLGDPDYQAAGRHLDEAFASGDAGRIRQICSTILEIHASSKERMPILESFYERLFSVTGKPKTILDLACGLNPFALPWMGLPADIRYYAYDIHQPRLDLINHFFSLQGIEPLGIKQDILVDPPQVEAEVALFFKEAHRFDQRQHGCNRKLWCALRVRYLLVSLPTNSLSGRHNLVERQRQLVYSTLAGLPWQVSELMFDSELVFCIDRQPDGK